MAQTIRDLILEMNLPQRLPRRTWLAATHLLALTAGFLACLLWFGGILTGLGANVAGIRQEIIDRHPKVITVSAGQAWKAIRPFNKRREAALVGRGGQP